MLTRNLYILLEYATAIIFGNCETVMDRDFGLREEAVEDAKGHLMMSAVKEKGVLFSPPSFPQDLDVSAEAEWK